MATERELTLGVPTIVRGYRGSSGRVAFAATLHALLLLCVAPPAASMLHREDHAPEADAFVGKQTPPGKVHPLVLARRADNADREVKCYQFTTSPVRTYCRVLIPSGYIHVRSGNESAHAESECAKFSMDLPRLADSSLERLKNVARIFGVRRFFALGADNTSQIFTCHERHGTGHPLLPSSQQCLPCDAAIVCETSLYVTGGPRCMTVQLITDSIEYCYYTDWATPSDSAKRCLERGATLGDLGLWYERERRYFRAIVYPAFEFWVDLKPEDVENAVAVLTFSTSGVNWKTSCFTLSWSPGIFPVLFKEDCGKPHFVLCDKKNGSSTGLSICGYADEESRASRFCWMDYPKKLQTASAGASQCKRLGGMSLIPGEAVTTEFVGSLRAKLASVGQTSKGGLIWDAQYGGGAECFAVNTSSDKFTTRRLDCSSKIGYVCAKQTQVGSKKVAPVSALDCERVDTASPIRPATCLNRAESSSEESVEACNRIGMYLLSEGLQLRIYEGYLRVYNRSSSRSDTSAFWLQTLVRCANRCVALTRNGTSLTVSSMNCRARLQSICVSPAAISPQSTNQSRCDTSEEDELDAQEKCEPHMADTCESPYVKKGWHEARKAPDIESAIANLKRLEDDIASHEDLLRICPSFTEFFERADSLMGQLKGAEKLNESKRLVKAVVSLVHRVLLKTEAWSCLPEKERQSTAARLFFSVEEFVSRNKGD